jgi:hypothetical protein
MMMVEMDGRCSFNRVERGAKDLLVEAVESPLIGLRERRPNHRGEVQDG